MLSCREAVRLISEGMDRSLPIWNRVGLRLHVLICTWCERYRRQLIFIRRAIRQQPDRLMEQEPSAGLSPDARERFKRAIRLQQDQ